MNTACKDFTHQSEALDERLRDLLTLHFHAELGSRYWLLREEALGWDVCDRVRTVCDLCLLGPTPTADFRRYALRDFIPRGLHRQLSRFIIGETGGTTGPPSATAYRDDEFQAAFIMPFLRVAAATGFPRNTPWLWVGPSGPHIIGKAVRELARQYGGMDAFSVDFDPRWAKRLSDGSLARKRYLDHVTNQALDVLEREQIGLLFTTPPALAALAARMTSRQREALGGVHYGGVSISPATLNEFRAAFPKAVHLAGYGNSLFGVLMEVRDGERESLDYFPLSDRVQFHVVDWNDGSNWPPAECERGRTGRVLFHRLDEGFFLPGVVERDAAERIGPSREALELGCEADGLRNPRPPSRLGAKLELGLY